MIHMNNLIDKVIPEKIPKHIAIIMDGNGRWALEKGKDRIYGHAEGVESVRSIIETAIELKVSYLTLYAFSTENWNRPQEEVDGLMDLLVRSLSNELDEFKKNDVRLLAIGNIKELPDETRSGLEKAINETKNNKKITLILALNYSAKWEIIQAIKAISEGVKQNKIESAGISEELISNYLSTRGIPDPELLIRTSGENRISNFLLWQIAYAELYFTDVLWPDFRRDDFINAVIEYQSRNRRFGMLSSQITN
jgi:undecaprenyl diphosphate synthase